MTHPSPPRPCEWPEARGEVAEYKAAPIDDRLMFFCKEHFADYAEGVNQSD